MSRSALHNIFLIALLIIFTGALGLTSGAGETRLRCIEAERQTLLQIKEELQEVEDGVLSSWGEEEGKRECCEWTGIRCDNLSGHVIKLDLSPATFGSRYDYPVIRGNISSSLVGLQYLKYLDLSKINLRDNSIPSSIDNLRKLNYLNLSHTSLGGKVPPQLGNLSGLQSLDLRYNHALNTGNLKWVSHLSSLQLLDLSNVNLKMANDWVQIVDNLPKLANLMLQGCNLPTVVHPSPSHVNSSKVLAFLDLSSNNDLSASVFQWLLNYSRSLVHVDLSFCRFESSIHENFGKNMVSLKDLDIVGIGLEGTIPKSFGNNMTALRSLDLSQNQLQGSIPESFGNMIALTYLDLSLNRLEGLIPEPFANMTSITYLDLSMNQLQGSIPESFGNMIALRYLDLSGKFADEVFIPRYLDLIGKFPDDENGNQLEGFIPQSFRNMTALTQLLLGGNRLTGSIPEGFGDMASLEFLDLSHNMLEGEIPNSIWKMCRLREFQAINNNISGQLQFAESSSKCADFSLEILDLTGNQITGSLPNVTLYSSLKELHLSSNQLNGNVSKSLSQLSKLRILDISKNSIKDVISEAHFLKLFNLNSLILSDNPGLVLNYSPDWNPPFQLVRVMIGSCNLVHFPRWLETQNGIRLIEMPNTKISGCIPNTFWNFTANKLMRVDLSNNEIRGAICDNEQSGGHVKISTSSYHPDIDLSSNQLEGSILQVLFEVSAALSLSRNQILELNSLCNTTTSMPLTILDVSYNQLSGELPDCWSCMNELKILILANNKLSGRIPVSIGSFTKIESLGLGNNSFVGELPSSLQELRNLSFLDVAENNLSGPIPAWIGRSVKHIAVLSLRSNNFYGSIPSCLCLSENLQVLDLASNNLSSSIPTCLGDLKAMKESGSSLKVYGIFAGYDVVRNDYSDELSEVWKGELHELKNLYLLKNMDLSSNKLTGEIPREITELIELVSLNLSRNNLSGQIPQEIGRLKSLDALDLSKNHLSGRIPSSLSQIDRLNTLDLSNNRLSGKIPTGTQLQTRDAAAYIGNPELCGDPLPKCPFEEDTFIDGAKDHVDGQEDQEEFINKGFYICGAAGFVVGFWGVCFTLIFNKSWRYRYFKSLDNAGDWLYVTVAVHKAKLLRIIKR